MSYVWERAECNDGADVGRNSGDGGAHMGVSNVLHAIRDGVRPFGWAMWNTFVWRGSYVRRGYVTC